VRIRRRILIAAVVAIVLAGLAFFFLRGPREPIYEGKPLSHWLNKGPHSRFQIDDLSAPSVHPVDTNALPFLLVALKRTDDPLHKLYETFWNTSPLWLSRRLSQPTPASVLHYNAANMLSQLGDSARPAIPDLVEILKHHPDSDARYYVIELLASIGKGDLSVSKALIDAVSNDPDAADRYRARKALEGIDPVAAARLPPNDPSTLK
jgi:hypothetical protein